MKQYGLLGYPLSHSFSPSFFTEKFERETINANYRSFPIKTIQDVEVFLSTTELEGLNITIPFKEKIIPFLDDVDAIAKKIGAVNCIVKRKHKWHGYNTDIIGFEESLLSFCSLKSKKALVFGTGGSSKAVGYVLQKHQVPFLSVSRVSLNDTITYSDLNESIFSQYQLLINTTPVGMFPSVDEVLTLPFHLINEHHFVFDLIYNPAQTKLLEFASLRGAKTKNGYEMLCIQAEASYKLFTTSD